MSENKCPKCGASISGNKQYCPRCEARLSLAIEAPIIIEKKAKTKKELSPKTKKRLKIAGIAVTASAIIGTTIGLLIPLVFVPNAQISEVKKGNIYSFNKIGDSYSVRTNPSLKKYVNKYLSSEIIIPSEYKGLPVTAIESDGFSSCISLTSITIPNSVTSIGDYAFSYCSSLESIIIPNSVTSIGDGVFYYCDSLTSITIPFVGRSATSSRKFEDLFGGFVPATLKEVVISDGCTSIGDDAFYSCRSLTSITIPNSVTSIGDDAFRNCDSLTSITIPNSVTSIGSRTFSGCSSLTSITIPNSVTSIGDGVFYYCNSLTSITIPFVGRSATSSGKFKDLFGGFVPATLKEVVISDGCTSIGDETFSNCNSLTSITIPNSITSIGDDAFSYCSSLTSITIPNSITSIGSRAFSGCSSLTSITIPNSVTSIGDYAFSYCSSLESIIIPNSVISVGTCIFYGCTIRTIYCYSNSKPDGWSYYWSDGCTAVVVWGYTE